MLRRGQNAPVVLYTMNGFQIRGEIVDFDDVTVLVEDGAKKQTQMVYKHALSTIALPQEKYQDKDSY